MTILDSYNLQLVIIILLPMYIIYYNCRYVRLKSN